MFMRVVRSYLVLVTSVACARRLVAGSLLALIVAMGTACSTKKFVRTEVGEVNQKVDTLTGTVEDTKTGAPVRPGVADKPKPQATVEDRLPAPAPPVFGPDRDRVNSVDLSSTAVLPPRATPSTTARTPRPAAGPPLGSPTMDRPSGRGLTTAFDALQEFIKNMRSAAGALRAAPNRVERGQEIDVTLTLSPGQTVEGLQKELQSPTANVDARVAKFAPRMSATLVVPEGAASVVGDNADPRAIDPEEGMIWRWRVTPSREGELRMTARLTAPVEIDRQQTPYEVRTFDAAVTVVVTPTTKLKDFVEAHWKWLWTALVVPAFAWWRKRSQSASATTAKEEHQSI